MVIEKKTCSQADCHDITKARGLCKSHYDKWLATRPDGKPCAIDGCSSVSFIRGLCQIHYSRMKYEARKVNSCSVENCGKALWAGGRCKKHWEEVRVVRVEKVTPLKEGMGMAIDVEKIKNVLTTGDVARICNVSPRTVTKWIDNETLQGYRIPGGLDRRCTKESFIRFMRDNKLPMHISVKRSVVFFGFDPDVAEIGKKIIEEETGVIVHIVQNAFEAGVLVTEVKPSAIFVDGRDLASIMPMIKAMDRTTAEIVVAIDDPKKLDGIDVNAIPSPFKIKDLIAAIAKYI